MSEYQINQRNKVKRIPDRGHYDHETVYAILDAGFLCHIGFVVNDQPFVIPTLYGRKDNKIYIHGASTSRMIKNLEKGFPVSLTVTHVDGLVLARSAFHHSMNYRSAVIFGTAKPVAPEKKDNALFVISENIIAGRWAESRKPNAKELKATAVLEIEIEQASAKIRTGGPKDDKPDYELNIWAGVIPMTMTYSEPLPDDLLKVSTPLPPSIKNLS
ncbi:MAG TPA: pyridoxamine 5'-phosphate oxidase family protein [Fulvivirga sp.]|nr:pyridoxamine 5'-phosphate oxidase family protein [Fulvivirga sp.]